MTSPTRSCYGFLWFDTRPILSQPTLPRKPAGWDSAAYRVMVHPARQYELAVSIFPRLRLRTRQMVEKALTPAPKFLDASPPALHVPLLQVMKHVFDGEDVCNRGGAHD